jgi:Glyoxalase/Bleomycin resistance protein/Dioxygenase superfamily
LPIERTEAHCLACLAFTTTSTSASATSRKRVPFYEVLLPALGFTRKTEIPDWFQYEAAAPDDGPAAFFGVTESPAHVPNESRIAFWAESIVQVDRLAGIAAEAGARNVEGPGWEDETYYAVFFEDPCRNRLEICHRTAPVKL